MKFWNDLRKVEGTILSSGKTSVTVPMRIDLVLEMPMPSRAVATM